MVKCAHRYEDGSLISRMKRKQSDMGKCPKQQYILKGKRQKPEKSVKESKIALGLVVLACHPWTGDINPGGS